MTFRATIDSMKLAARLYQDDPADATVARYIAWVPMSEHFMALLTLISGTGVAASGFAIYAATSAGGANPTLVREHLTPTDADAAGDQLYLETDSPEVQAALPLATHVSVHVINAAAGDVNAVCYLRTGFAFNNAGLTADVIG